MAASGNPVYAWIRRSFSGEMKSSNNRNPVLLVHGIWDTSAIFNTMSAYLSQLGWSVCGLSLTPSNGDKCLDHLAGQIADCAAKTFGPEQPFDLIGFSMGGIVSRYYLQRLGGIDRVQRFITISSPHHGTLTGYASRRPGCVQMRPNSQFLRDLNRDVAMLEKLNFTSIWTPYDLMIFPATSSKMPVGREVIVPVPLHGMMVKHPKVIKAVAEALAEPVKVRGETVSLRLEPR